MAVKDILKDINGNDIYPNTRPDCVYSKNGKTMDEILGNERIEYLGDGTVTGSIASLAENLNNCKYKIVDGKKLIAEAITVRGVATSYNDSFEVMENNINNIIVAKSGQVDVNSQNKSAKLTPLNPSVVLVPDADYDALETVYANLETYESTVNLTQNKLNVSLNKEKFLTKLTVKGPQARSIGKVTLDAKTSSINLSEGYYNGSDSVNIFLQDKTVDFKHGSVVVKPDVGKLLSSVTINGPTNNKGIYFTLYPGHDSVNIPEGYHNGTGQVVIKPETKEETVLCGTRNITPSPTMVLSEVTVHGPKDYRNTTSTASVNRDGNYMMFSLSKNGSYDETSVLTIENSKLGNNNLIVNGVQKHDELNLTRFTDKVTTYIGECTREDLPMSMSNGCAVLYRDEIHLFSGSSHKKLSSDGDTFIDLSNLPFTVYSSKAVVYKDAIHILGLNSHYKWDGVSWEKLEDLPYYFRDGGAVVYNDEIHILGGGSGDDTLKHYRWDGTNWIRDVDLPYKFSNGGCVVLNNNIHILGGSLDNYSHYKWNGTNWTQLASTHFGFSHGACVATGQYIHIIGGGGGDHFDSFYLKAHCLWNSETDTWSFNPAIAINYSFTGGACVTKFNDIYLFGSTYTQDNENVTRSVLHYNSILQTLKKYNPTIGIDSDSVLYIKQS